jgi:hypothetical protein
MALYLLLIIACLAVIISPALVAWVVDCFCPEPVEPRTMFPKQIS